MKSRVSPKSSKLSVILVNAAPLMHVLGYKSKLYVFLAP